MKKLLYLIAFLVVNGNVEGIPSQGCLIMERHGTQTGIKECDTEEAVTCINPNNRTGTCTSFNNCKPLLNLLTRGQLSKDSERFLRDSACPGSEGSIPNYCCTDDSGYIKKKRNIYFPPVHMPLDKPSNGVGKYIPDSKQCGPPTADNKILSGEEAGIDEFPWMVLIEYRKNGERKLSCAGSVINQRYVVTAAHCFSSKFEAKVGTPALVRLGDHNINTEIDCKVGEEDFCNMRILEIGIEKIITHENFDINSTNKANDIALIRLNQNIPNDNLFIQPICLPSAVRHQTSQTGRSLTVAGWGQTENATSSNIKLKLDVPVIPHDSCYEKYATLKVEIISSQLCAGGNLLQDSCFGDSGGPLMVYIGSFWVLEGIVSFGHTCGKEGWPGVYTRVRDYEYWIKQNLEE